MDSLFEERASACALNRIFGYTPRVAAALIRELGCASAAFSLSQEQLHKYFGARRDLRDKIVESALRQAREELQRLEEEGCSYISLSEDCYPTLLKECDDAPAGLYVRSGTAAEKLFNRAESISIVGTRDISPYGKEWCERMVGAISESPSKPLIVSGLAFGVDITAHMAALACGLSTIAVLPVGIDSVYPSSHRVAAGKIASAPGSALVTDYPPGTAALGVNFLRRNRIIAGLSRATILVESRAKGGGTMTARLAAGYGRDVFALPGRIEDKRSEGCNILLKEKIAEPIISLGCLGAELGLGEYRLRRAADLSELVREHFSLRGDTDADALAQMAALVKRRRGITLDELCEETSLSYSRVSSLALRLQSEGFIDIDLLQRCYATVRRG